MCIVSMIMDHYSDKWRQYQIPGPSFIIEQPQITKAELDEFRQLLERAREYDRKHNQPDCELEEKRQRVKDLAKELGVEIEFV